MQLMKANSTQRLVVDDFRTTSVLVVAVQVTSFYDPLGILSVSFKTSGSFLNRHLRAPGLPLLVLEMSYSPQPLTVFRNLTSIPSPRRF